MNQIKNIIFDLGNVIVNLDYQATEDQLIALLGKEAFDKVDPNLWDDFETGQFSAQSFINKLQRATDRVVQPDQIVRAWNAMLLDIPVARIKMLEELQKKYKLYILSNTNSIHIEYEEKYLKEQFQIEDPNWKYFEKVYLSHLIRLRKPNVEIYQYVIDDADILPEESLFIDDKEENIVGAQKVGIETIHLPPGDEVIEALMDMRILNRTKEEE